MTYEFDAEIKRLEGKFNGVYFIFPNLPRSVLAQRAIFP